eukprot:bmy_19777T0
MPSSQHPLARALRSRGSVPPPTPAKETSKKKKFSLKKPFKLSGLSFKRNRKEVGGDSSASSPTEEGQEQGQVGACSEGGTAQEGKAAATREPGAPGQWGRGWCCFQGRRHRRGRAPGAEHPLPGGPTPASEQNE